MQSRKSASIDDSDIIFTNFHATKENDAPTMTRVNEMKPLPSLTEAPPIPLCSLEPPRSQPSAKIEDDQEQMDDDDGTYCCLDDLNVSIQPVSVGIPVPAPPKEDQTSAKPSDCNERDHIGLPGQLAADNIYTEDQMQLQVDPNSQNKQQTGHTSTCNNDSQPAATLSDNVVLEAKSSTEDGDSSGSEWDNYSYSSETDSSESNLGDISSPITEQKQEYVENIELYHIPSEIL